MSDIPEPPRRPIRTADIAEQLGLSRTAVSFVLNQSSNAHKVSPENQQRILKLAEAWNYVPNQVATTLQAQRSSIIGVIFADLTYSWADRLLSALNSVLSEHHYLPLIAVSWWDPAREREEIRSMQSRQVDGIITVAPTLDNLDAYRVLEAAGTPILFVGDALPQTPEFSHVVWDEGHAICAGVDHLVDRGRQRIALLMSRHQSLLQRERRDCFLKHVKKRFGKAASPQIIEVDNGDGVKETLEPIMRRPTQDRPDAILATTDALAYPVLNCIDQMKLRIPEDVAVMGLGDLPPSRIPRVGLTTIEAPTLELGRKAGHAILELINESSKGAFHSQIRSDRVVHRNST
jgi:DNA-binding LacI/PurR family transcriptional regulator